VFTFTRYNLSRPSTEGEIFFNINEEGEFVSSQKKGTCIDGDNVKYSRFGYNGVPFETYCIVTNTSEVCIDKGKLCTDPITVDSRTFKTVIAINKQFPGPTLIVYEGQTIVDVHNNMNSEGISIHWHGQHQVRTNWMDGVGLVTQCPIQPGGSFRYIFKAAPSGTFWYHSHMGSQRTNGLFGALIVREREISYPIPFEDNPAAHTITLMDWFWEDFEAFFRSVTSTTRKAEEVSGGKMAETVSQVRHTRDELDDLALQGGAQVWDERWVRRFGLRLVGVGGGEEGVRMAGLNTLGHSVVQWQSVSVKDTLVIEKT